ncbi:MAG: hypothetical protein M3N68_11675, partial [Actinomycetota bacterium]|nr:hypothetical protein [Actinomycetota bacterium]
MANVRAALGLPADVLRRPERLLVALAALAVVVLATCAPRAPDRDEAARPRRDNAVTVGSFNFSESVLLAEIYAQALEAAGIPVKREFEVGT